MGAAAITEARGGRGGGAAGLAAGRTAVTSPTCSCEARRIAEMTAVSRPDSGTIRTRTRPLLAA